MTKPESNREANQIVVTNRRMPPVERGIAMYPYMDVARVISEERQKEFMRKAEVARAMAEMPDDGVSRIAAVRRQVGAAMVRAGERVQGVQQPEAAAELPYGARLTIVR
ncbi:MAG: hypothetical protein ACRDJW_08995 [Thermomicrobiales bacterium]